MTTHRLDDMGSSSSGAFITKSATSMERDGNPKPRYVSVPLGSINSMGLPNKGIDYYLDYFLNRQESFPSENRPFMSVAGMSIDENIKLLHRMQDSNFRGITELNLSCPNIPGKPRWHMTSN